LIICCIALQLLCLPFTLIKRFASWTFKFKKVFSISRLLISIGLFGRYWKDFNLFSYLICVKFSRYMYNC
jgi:hypothetical protein